MHRISNDPRCTKTCEMLYCTLVEMLHECHMDIERVSVSSLTAQAGVARATFYRHFDRPIDILAWMVEKKEKEAADKTILQTGNFYSFALVFFGHWTGQDELLDLIMAARQSELLLFALSDSMKENADLFFKRSPGLSKARREYTIDIWTSIIWSILRRWTLNGKKETVQDLADIAVRTMPLPH